jgi:hypothetical protein
MASTLPDKLTLIALSALAYLLAVALHEHLGHATACVGLGSHVSELGAFFVDCDDTRLSSAAVRAVAVAGPLVSLLTGVVSLWLLPRLPRSAPRACYFTWLLGTLGLMNAAGYLLFSGVAGVGDLGTGADGALRGAQPEWLWRSALSVCGAASYWLVVRISLRLIAPHLEGSGAARARRGSRIALISYVTGAVLYLAIGLLNPYGVLIVIESALASSLGGSSGLLWMMSGLERQPAGLGPDLNFSRSPAWIAIAAICTLAYAIVLGPR